MRFNLSKKLGLATSILLCFTTAFSQKISPFVIGQNAHMPDFSWGKLGQLWDDMDRANFTMIRIGGKGAMTYAKDYDLLFKQIDGVRLATAEPIVQVPYEYSRQKTIDYVTHINITHNKKIKYWSIGNEPLHNKVGSSTFISNYLKRIGSAIKEVDPNAIVMGPDYAWYRSGEFAKIMGGSEDVTQKDANGNYPIDYMVWHQYGSSLISKVEPNVNDMLARLANVNADRPAGKKMGWAIGEINTHWDMNLVSDPDNYTWSFHAGQYFAELYGLGMRKGALTICPWSMAEGQKPRAGTDLGFFEQDDLTPRSSYWHSFMLGNNLKENYLAHTDNRNNITIIPMGDTTGTSVMILNKSKTTAFDYHLKLNLNDKTGTGLVINVDAGLTQELAGNIGAYSTQMLTFCPDGKLFKKYTYTSKNADDRTGVTIESISDSIVGGTGASSWKFLHSYSCSSVIEKSGEYSISINEVGDKIYIPQLVQDNFSFVKGKQYTLKFTAFSETARTLEAFVNSGPGDYLSFLKKEVALTNKPTVYAYTFTAKHTDKTSRLDFNLGGSDVNLVIKDITLEENILTSIKDSDLKIHSNSTKTNLIIETNKNAQMIDILNFQGVKIQSFQPNSSQDVMKVLNLTAGIYFIRVISKEGLKTYRFVQQ